MGVRQQSSTSAVHRPAEFQLHRLSQRLPHQLLPMVHSRSLMRPRLLRLARQQGGAAMMVSKQRATQLASPKRLKHQRLLRHQPLHRYRRCTNRSCLAVVLAVTASRQEEEQRQHCARLAAPLLPLGSAVTVARTLLSSTAALVRRTGSTPTVSCTGSERAAAPSLSRMPTTWASWSALGAVTAAGSGRRRTWLTMLAGAQGATLAARRWPGTPLI